MKGEIEMAAHLDYEQFLDTRIEQKLFCGDLNVLLTAIQNDKELLFEIRKGKAIIYYSGCKIIEISVTGSLSIDEKYARTARRKTNKNQFQVNKNAEGLLKDLNSQKRNYALWIKHLDSVKKILSDYRKNVTPNDEREKQQRIATANDSFNSDIVILDTEYAVREFKKRSSHLAKVDMVGICKNSDGKYDIVLIELKVGDKALTGKAGIGSHVRDIDTILKHRTSDLKKSVSNIIGTKHKLGLLRNFPKQTPKLSGKYKAVILAYDLTQSGKTKVNTERKNIKAKPGINVNAFWYCEQTAKSDKLSATDLFKTKF
jgi:hypothetical protein